MAEQTTRAIGYVRTATTTDTRAQSTIELQAQCIRDYCHTNSIALVGLFADEVANGNTTARKGLHRALSALRAGEADKLIVTSTSRLSRSVAALATLAEEHFADGSRALVAIDEYLDTRTNSGRFMFRALCLLARWSRR